MKKLLNGLIISLLVTACSDPATPENNSNSATASETATKLSLKQQVESITKDYFVLRPEIATYYGVSDASINAKVMSKLTDYSPSGETHRRKGLK